MDAGHAGGPCGDPRARCRLPALAAGAQPIVLADLGLCLGLGFISSWVRRRTVSQCSVTEPV